MKTKTNYSSIKDALSDGYKMHGFTSGGRLRVLSLTKEGTKKEYYGEGIDFHSALRILSDDVVAGGREYKDVYGDGKIETAYWTGRYPDPGDVIDTWFYQGYGFDVEYDNENNHVVVKLVKKHLVRTPENIVSTVTKWKKSVKWKFKDFDNTYVSSLGDRGGCCTSADDVGSDPWFKEMYFEGKGNDLSVAMTNAFAQTEKSLAYVVLD